MEQLGEMVQRVQMLLELAHIWLMVAGWAFTGKAQQTTIPPHSSCHFDYGLYPISSQFLDR
jgi:hypothetical protein